jgi:site-specific recombinase XerD
MNTASFSFGLLIVLFTILLLHRMRKLHAYGDSMRAKRDYLMLAMLFGCGFRRSELVGLELDEIQMRQVTGQRWI